MKSMSEFIEEALKRMPPDSFVAVQCDATRYKANGKIELTYRASCIPLDSQCRNSGQRPTPEEAINELITAMYPPINPVQPDILLPAEEK